MKDYLLRVRIELSKDDEHERPVMWDTQEFGFRATGGVATSILHDVEDSISVLLAKIEDDVRQKLGPTSEEPGVESSKEGNG